MSDWIEPAVNIVFGALALVLLVKYPGQGNLEAHLCVQVSVPDMAQEHREVEPFAFSVPPFLGGPFRRKSAAVRAARLPAEAGSHEAKPEATMNRVTPSQLT